MSGIDYEMEDIYQGSARVQKIKAEPSLKCPVFGGGANG